MITPLCRFILFSKDYLGGGSPNLKNARLPSYPCTVRWILFVRGGRECLKRNQMEKRDLRLNTSCMQVFSFKDLLAGVMCGGSASLLPLGTRCLLGTVNCCPSSSAQVHSKRLARELLIAQIHAQLSQDQLLPHNYSQARAQAGTSPLQQNCKIKARIVHNVPPKSSSTAPEWLLCAVLYSSDLGP